MIVDVWFDEEEWEGGDLVDVLFLVLRVRATFIGRGNYVTIDFGEKVDREIMEELYTFEGLEQFVTGKTLKHIK